MNRKAISLQSVAISGVMFILVVLLSPFMFELLGVANLTGIEGFLAKLVPFVMLWSALRSGSYLAVGA